jgi:hypothetical protein
MNERDEEYRIKLGRRVIEKLASVIHQWAAAGRELTPLEAELKGAFSEYQVNRMPADEPIFCLRAQDCHAATAVRFWARSVETDPSADQRLVGYAIGKAQEMEQWPIKKHPDLPRHRTVGEVMGTAPSEAENYESRGLSGSGSGFEMIEPSTPGESTPSSSCPDQGDSTKPGSS